MRRLADLPQERVVATWRVVAVRVLISHAERVRPGQRRERRVARRVRVVALGAAESEGLAQVAVPVAECLAVGAALPVAISRAVALGAEGGDLREGDGGAVVETEAVVVVAVVAVEAAVVQAVAQNDLAVHAEFGDGLVDGDEDAVAVLAALGDAVDHGLGRVVHGGAPGAGVEVVA